MRLKRYLVLGVLATSLLVMAACGGQSAATPEPFARYKAVDVLKGLTDAHLSVVNPQRGLAAAAGAPLSFNDRYSFNIALPNGTMDSGQLLIFNSPEALKKWQDFITTQKASSETRRNWLFVYTYKNVMLQVSPDLSNDQAEQYNQALQKLP